MGDRCDFHWHVVLFQRDVTVRFTEGAFRLDNLWINHAFYDQFGFGRYQQVDGHALHHINRAAGQSASDIEFVNIDW